MSASTARRCGSQGTVVRGKDKCTTQMYDDLDLEIGINTLDHDSPHIEGTLGSMVASLHGVKKYLTLKIVGQAGG